MIKKVKKLLFIYRVSNLKVKLNDCRDVLILKRRYFYLIEYLKAC